MALPAKEPAKTKMDSRVPKCFMILTSFLNCYAVDTAYSRDIDS